MNKTVAKSVVALSALALVWPVSSAQAKAVSKPKLTCLHVQSDDFEPGPAKNGICLIYKNKYSKNS